MAKRGVSKKIGSNTTSDDKEKDFAASAVEGRKSGTVSIEDVLKIQRAKGMKI